MPTLYIIDGYAQFFRAYHAIRSPMSSPVTGEPTNMTFGFVGMLLKLLRGEGHAAADAPSDRSVIVTIDKGGDRETFRSEIYPDYKAHRPPPPPDLFPQVDRCLSLLTTVGVPVIGEPGFEADDVIATLVTRLTAERPDLRIRIVSKDKDLKQLLVQGRVELYDIHTDAIIDQATLKSETGIDPPQVAEMLALMGDSSDNIPGVEGIGPKTAAELIARFGTAQAVLEAARASASMGKDAPIKGARAEKIRAAADILAISRQLVELRRDVPITLDLASAAQSSFRLDSLMPLLRELGFNRYQDELRSLLGSNTSSGAGASAAGLESARQATSPNSAPRSIPSAVAARARPTASDSPAGTLFASLDDSSGAQDGMSHISSRAAGAATRGTYRCARSEADYAELAAELAGAKVISLDTETTGLSPMRSELVGVSISTRAGAGWYLPCRSPEPATHAAPDALAAFLRTHIAGSSTPIVGHNLKFDLLVLRRAGVEIANFDSRAFDTLIASFLIDSGRSSHSLDALALSLLGHTNISIKELLGSGASQKTFDAVPLELATEYAAEDADVALRLHDLFAPQLRAMELDTLFRDVELPLVAVLADLEFNGVLLDTAELERQRARLVKRMAELKAELDDQTHAALGRTINPDSPKQLAAALFNAPTDAEPGLGIKPVKKTKTGFSTDIEVLETLSEDASITTPIPRLIADHRQLAKLVGTYLESLRDEVNPRTGRIHASFNQTVAVTGRLSSSDPNLQNIPIRTDLGREIRRAFVAPTGSMLISADYSQIELRLLAHLSRDPALIDAFLKDQDIHTAVAAQIHGVPLDAVTREQRSGAKMVNFGIVYGITPFGLARRLGISNDQASDIIDSYKRRFAGITTFLQECVEQARARGYVRTMLGRRRPVPEIESPNPSRRALAERIAINSVVQGSAADLIKLAMIDIARAIRGEASSDASAAALRDTKMILQIHDELVFECPAAYAEAARGEIVRRMESAMTLTVPLKADSSVARDWFEEA